MMVMVMVMVSGGGGGGGEGEEDEGREEERKKNYGRMDVCGGKQDENEREWKGEFGRGGTRIKQEVEEEEQCKSWTEMEEEENG